MYINLSHKFIFLSHQISSEEFDPKTDSENPLRLENGQEETLHTSLHDRYQCDQGPMFWFKKNIFVKKIGEKIWRF
jgi:hypothetical protein